MECKNGFARIMITAMEFLLFLLATDEIIEYILIYRGKIHDKPDGSCFFEKKETLASYS